MPQQKSKLCCPDPARDRRRPSQCRVTKGPAQSGGRPSAESGPTRLCSERVGVQSTCWWAVTAAGAENSNNERQVHMCVSSLGIPVYKEGQIRYGKPELPF